MSKKPLGVQKFFMVMTLIFCFGFSISSTALAWPPTFGGEIEFSHPSLNRRSTGDGPRLVPWKEKESADRLAKAFREGPCDQGECDMRVVRGKWGEESIVTFRNTGWWIRISWDPGVVEIATSPSALEDIEKNMANLKVLYDLASQSNLKPDEDLAGHFNIGVETAFEGNVELFMRFFMDNINHPFLFLGALGRDIGNAPTVSILKPEQRAAMADIVADFNRTPTRSIRILARTIERRVYSSTPIFGGGHHYQSIGLKSITRGFSTEAERVELRGIRDQVIPGNFSLLAKLFQARIEFLKKQTGPIIYVDIAHQFKGWETKPYNDSELLNKFYVYVTEMGLAFDEYIGLLPKNVVKEYRKWRIELDPFLKRQVNWSKSKHVEIVGSWIEGVLTSAMVEELMIDALTSDPRTAATKMDIVHQLYVFASKQGVPGLLENPGYEKFLNFLKKVIEKLDSGSELLNLLNAFIKTIPGGDRLSVQDHCVDFLLGKASVGGH